MDPNNNDPYQNMFSTLDQQLPGLGLRRDGDKWIARTGTTPCCKAKAKDHLYIYHDTAFGLKCHRCGEFTHMSKLLSTPASTAPATAEPAPLVVDAAQAQQRHDFLAAFLRYCHRYLFSDAQEAQQARAYLEGRGFTLTSPRMANFGYCPDATTLAHGFTERSFQELETVLPGYGSFQHRIVFGITGTDGRLTGICGRVWLAGSEADGSPKYLYAEHTDRAMPYGLQDVDPTQPVLITEGIFTPEILIPKGVPNVVAVGGSKVTDKQITALMGKGVKTVILALDWDPQNHAGEDGTERSIDALARAGLRVYVIPPRWMVDLQATAHKEDPDSYVQQYGAEAYLNLMRQAVDPEVFLVDRELYTANPTLPMDQDRVWRHAAQVLCERRPDAVVVERLARWVAGWAGMDVAGVTARLDATLEALRRERQCGEAQAVLSRAAEQVAAGNLEQAKRIVTAKLPLWDASRADQPIPYFNADRFLDDISKIPTDAVTTGITPLDEQVKILPGELVIVCARVRHGKSSFAYNLMLNMIALHPDRTFILFSHEVPVHFVIARMVPTFVHRHHGVRLDSKTDVILKLNQRLADGSSALPPQALSAIHQFGGFGSMGRLIVVYEPHWNADEVRSFVQRVRDDGRHIGGVFIDYAEMVPPLDASAVREQQIGQTVHALRLMANELAVPVFLLSQMNRDHREPSLEGLRYSGQLEQEASTAIGLYNPAVEDIVRQGGYLDDATTQLSIRVLKNRGGGQCHFDVLFDMRTGLIGMPLVTPDVRAKT